jgi:hypothetical protein
LAIDAYNSETSTDIIGTDEIDDSDDQIAVAIQTTPKFAVVSDESLSDAKETNEALAKSGNMDINELATLVKG